MNQEQKRFPVVIVGKNRTRMTFEVVRHLQNHLKGKKVRYIVVSDRSRDGHIEAVEEFFREMEPSVDWTVMKTTESHYGWGGAMNLGLTEAFSDGSEVALLIDNDWLLQRDIDIIQTENILTSTPMGCLTYKHINDGTNVVQRKINYRGENFIVREEGTDKTRPSYPVEIGCMSISKTFYDRFGQFLENVNQTDLVERDFIKRYLNGRELNGPAGSGLGYLFGSQEKYQHDFLNGANHVFTHVGKDSQSGRNQTWGIPEKYLDLSNEEKDVRMCNVYKKLPNESRKAALWEMLNDACGEKAGITILEIGSFEGESSEIFICHPRVRKIICVDPWANGIEYDDPLANCDMAVCEKNFDDRMREYLGVEKFKGTIDSFIDSDLFKENIGKIDLVYVDGNHEYKYVRNDIQKVLEFIKPNLGICGHDYSTRFEHIKGVVRAVDEFFGQPKKVYPDTSWSMAKRLDGNSRYEEEIVWENFADKIYCTHYIPQSDKFERLKKELQRVGLLDSPIFSFRYTEPSVYDHDIFEKRKHPAFCNRICHVNLCLEIRKILQESLDLGYQKIILMEDDVAFLKSKSAIFDLLNGIPVDADLVQFDKYVLSGKMKERYDELCKSEEGNFILLDAGDNFTSSSILWMNRNGMKEMLRLMDEQIIATDQTFRFLKCRKYLSKKNLGVQVLYGTSFSYEVDGIKTMHDVYLNQGCQYSDYELPDGYGVGSYMKGDEVVGSTSSREFLPEEHVIGNKSKGRKKVSVYAIAKNESKNVDKWMSSMSEADEVVVLDTGSTDDTVEHLRRLGARVEVEKFNSWKTVEEYDELMKNCGNPWRFDKARNDSMKLIASDTDICVTTDIDEFIQPGWRKKLEDQWIAAEERGEHPTCAAYKYVWCYNPDGSEARTFEIHKIHARGVCHWTHMIHEVLHYDLGDIPVYLTDFTVEHHQDFSKQKQRKLYLPMLQISARDNPENDRDCHYYGRELMYAGRWDEAIAELKRHLSLKTAAWRAERAASMRYISFCYGAKGMPELEELWLWKAIHEDPRHREASFKLAKIFIARKDYKSGEAALETCVGITERSQEYISDNLVWGAEPWILYSQCLWWNGCWGAAENAVRKALELEPENIEARNQLDGMASTRQKYNR